MDLSGVISISGIGGLHKVIAQAKNGVIVESLTDKKRFPAYSTSKISALEDISIYTKAEDISLKEVFKKILDKEKGGPAIDHKSLEPELLKYFETVLPEYDKERVHISDIRKLIGWYNLLQKTDLLTREPEEDKKAEAAEMPKPAAETEKKKKTAIKKNTAAAAKPLKTNTPKVHTQTPRKTGTA